MATRIRLARAGAKKRPFYHVVVAHERSSRDGAFIEKIGTYNPIAPKKSEERFKFNAERLQFWLKSGAQPSEAVKRYLVVAGILQDSKKDIALRAKSAKRREEVKQKAEAEKAKAEAEAAAAANPAPEAPAA